MINRCKCCDLPFFPLTGQFKYCLKCRRKGISYYTKKEVVEKNCATCNTQFKTHIKIKKYCSDKCREDADQRGGPLLSKVCSFCEGTFKTKSKIKKFCSNDCYTNNKAKRSRESYEISRPVKM